jgi:hypothetical protein
MILNLAQWALLFAALMPILVGLVTKANASAATKAITLLALDAVNGVLTDWFTTPNGFDWPGALTTTLVAFVTSVAAYYGLLKHTVSPPVNRATATFGIGGVTQLDDYRRGDRFGDRDAA